MGLGRVDEGADRLREAMSVAQRAGIDSEVNTAYVNLADHLHLVGRSAEAEALAAEGEVWSASTGARWPGSP